MAKQRTDGGRNWYAINTFTGYEKAVVKNIRQRIESLNAQDLIFNVMIPSEKKIKVIRGKQVVVDQNMYPGYVLVEMIVNDESWHIVRNTPRVTGFLGTGIHPVPVTDTEMAFLIDKLQNAGVAQEQMYFAGDLVKIIDGPFKGTEGKVLEYDEETQKVKVSVEIFGKDSSVDLDTVQIKKI